MAKRGIDGAVLNIPEEMTHSGKTYSVEATLKQGIDTPLAKKSLK